MRRMVMCGLICLLMAPPLATAEDRNQGILAAAEQLAAEVELQPTGVSGGGSRVKYATTLALVGAGIGLVLAGSPEYVPSQFAPGNYPNRVDLSMYLGAGNYPGHSYRLQHRRGDDYRKAWSCTGGFAGRCATDNMLEDNYRWGYTDGFDDGAYAGAVVGHERGWLAGQNAVVRILDANGFVVYDGEFIPASYVKEQFNDRKNMRYGGIGLIAAGTILNLIWPSSPARTLYLAPLPSGGKVGASFGF